MVTLRMFAGAREASGTASDEFDAATVDAVIAEARARYGAAFSAVMDNSRVWLNGEEAPGETPVVAGDEVAVLPPVSGG